MTYQALFLYFVNGVIAVVAVVLAYKMKTTYPQRFLSTLFYMVLLFYVGNFFSRTVPRMLYDLMNISSAQAQRLSGFRLIFILMPLFVVGLYLLIKVANRMVGRELSTVFKWFFFTTWGIYLSLLFVLLLRILQTGQGVLDAAILLQAADLVGIVMRFSTLGFLVYRSQEIKDPTERKAVKGFGILWFSGLLVFNVSSVFLGGIPLYMLIFFYPLPPLFYLDYYLRRYLREHPAVAEEKAELQRLFKKYNISQREQEVIGLISQGKSNKEIADVLFISLSTVKLHTHSIYRKLNIKNRVQLSNFIRNSMRN